MIRYLTREEKGKCLNLWKESFPEDTEKFMDYYFQEKTESNQILVVEEAGRILSMLHRNPYLVQVGSGVWQCDYIVGVATAADRRKQGLMRQLLTKALYDMRSAGMPFCFLMPASEEIYLPFDFTYISKLTRPVLDKDIAESQAISAERISKNANECELEAIAVWMQSWLKERYEVYSIRDSGYVRTLLRELASENGYLEVLHRDGEITGLLGMWGAQQWEQRLLLSDKPYIREIKLGKPAIMGRILHLEEFLKAIRLQTDVEAEEKILNIRIVDGLLPENNGLWSWNLNHVTSFITPAEASQTPHLRLSIQELTSWLFGYNVPAQAEKYKNVVRTLRGVFLDEVV